MDDTAKDDDTHEVLKKYNKFRKQKLQTAKKPWEGPTHKKFSQYLEDDSSSSASEPEEEEQNESDKENSSPENDESSTEALESDNESLILPAKTLPMEQEQPRTFELSDSEPEDPEEVRKYQERLKSRRSRVAQNPSNFSVMSVRNRTINHNRTTNLTIQPHLLDLSSSEDEETIRGVIKDSDDEDFELEAKPSPVSPPKKRKVEIKSPAKAPVVSTPPRKGRRSSPVKVPVVSTPPRKGLHNSPAKTPVASTPPVKMLHSSPAPVTDSQPVPDIYPLPELDTPYSSSSESKTAKTNRISTPKPTDLKASKLLKKTTRRSRNLAADKQQLVTASKSSPVKAAVNVTPKKIVSPVKDAPKSSPKTATPPVASKTKAKSNKSISTSSPSLSGYKPPSLTAQHLAATKPKANATASPSKFFKSKSVATDEVAKAPVATLPEPTIVEPLVQQDVYENLESDNLNEAADVPVMTATDTPEQSTGRRTRSSVGKRKSTGRASLAPSSAAPAAGPTTRQGSKTSTPGNKSLTLRSTKKAEPVEASAIKEAAVSPQNKQRNDQQTGANQPQPEQAVIPPIVQPSTAPFTPPMGILQPTVELVGSPPAAYAGVRFTSQHRLADAQDPVQSCLIHQTPQFYSILWKLLPGVVNWSRTRGETCILVFEGSVEVEGTEYPRGHLLKLPAFHTFAIKNNSESTVAMFQVTEYL